MNEKIAAWPKAQLHIHLEGSISLVTLRKIAARKGLPLPADDFYNFNDFTTFNNIFPLLSPFITAEEDFYEITLDFIKGLKSDNIVYCEAFFMPLAHTLRGVPFEGCLKSIVAALEEGEKEYGIKVNLIYSIPRLTGNGELGQHTLDLIKRYPHQRIIGIDLSGTESRESITPFAQVFAEARAMGLHTVAHAGEFGGPENIWDTIKLLGAERIGHGINAWKDERLIEYLREQDIPLEICPQSNVMLKAVSSLEEHPVRYLYEQGVPLIINTDDPAFFTNTLTGELSSLAEKLGFSSEELAQLTANSFQYSFGGGYLNGK